jgi:predicted GNAT family acetyltransferase
MTGKFYFPTEDANDAVVDYKLHTEGEPNLMEITHTFVPPTLRNKGLAEKITHTALNFADINGYKVRPSCPFTHSYLKKHPEFNHLLD